MLTNIHISLYFFVLKFIKVEAKRSTNLLRKFRRNLRHFDSGFAFRVRSALARKPCEAFYENFVAKHDVFDGVEI